MVLAEGNEGAVMPEYRVFQTSPLGMSVTDLYALLGKAHADSVFYQQQCANLQSQLDELTKAIASSAGQSERGANPNAHGG